jgi:beta-lactamase superfamily II metal-dependent hydrolase
MPRVHFLNVNDGDCSIIEHLSRHITVIDVSSAEKVGEPVLHMSFAESLRQYSKSAGVMGNFNRSQYPDNPIAYMKDRGLTSVFRFISTHPDMDHLDGIKEFFEEFRPINFWDTDNTKEIEEFNGGKYDEDDWRFYCRLRDGKPQTDPKRLVLYSGAKGPYYNQNENGEGGGDGLAILAPTPELVADANEREDWNDSSYVILYRTGNKRILFSGDSHDQTWEHILDRWPNDVANVDVLIAPHHGRDSGRSYDFLDVVKPKLTLFGNGPSEYLAYDVWNDRDLLFITNNQAGTIIVVVDATGLNVFVSHKPFAEAFVEQRGYSTHYDSDVRGWYIGTLT